MSRALRTRTTAHGRHPDAPRPATGKSGLTFRRELAWKVRDGDKTQTRRLVKPGETSYRLAPGDRIAVQPGRGKKAICRILITSVEQQQLGELDHRGARAEGFRTTDEFIAYWRELHHLGLPDRLREILQRIVDAPSSLPAAAIHPGLGDAKVARRLRDLEQLQLVYRVGSHWEITDRGVELLVDEREGVDLTALVWVITFKLVRQVDSTAERRMLARGGGTDGRGYTTISADALVNEPEVLDGREDARWSNQADLAKLEGSLSTLEARLARARERAEAGGVDIANHERAIEERLCRLERLIDRQLGEAA